MLLSARRSRRFGDRPVAGSQITVAVAVLVGGVLVTNSGCSRNRLFGAVDGQNGLFSPDRDANVVRVTSENAQPETDLEPVPQRLATTEPGDPRSAAARRPMAPPSRESELRSAYGEIQTVSANEPISNTTPRPESVATAKLETPIAPSTKTKAALPKLPDQAAMAGVDLTELMAALKDAPPEVQAQAIRRLMAMSHQQAQPTDQPASIENWLASSLDSLPTLPEEVVDQGLTPKRLASSETTMRLSDGADAPASQTAIPAAAKVSSGDAISATTAVLKRTSVRDDAVVAKTASGSRSQNATPGGVDATMTPAVGKQSRQAAAIHGGAANPVELTEAELFDTLVTRLSQPAEGESETDRYRREIMLRHLQVLSGDPDRAVGEVDGLTTQQQEFLRHQLLGLWTILDPKGHPVASRRFSSALPDMREATKFLAASTDTLDVKSLEFCTEIEAYGQIKPFPHRRFEPAQEVILYCEIENFVSQSVDRGFETVLQGSYDVIDSAGKRVASQTLPVDRQISRNQLRDFFIAYQMHLPASLPAGGYVLRLTMEDVHGRKYGQAELEFDMVGG